MACGSSWRGISCQRRRRGRTGGRSDYCTCWWPWPWRPACPALVPGEAGAQAPGLPPVGTNFAGAGPYQVTVQNDAAHTYYSLSTLGANGVDHPIILWGNGTGTTPPTYDGLLRHLASHGFVVAAANTTQRGQRERDAGRPRQPDRLQRPERQPVRRAPRPRARGGHGRTRRAPAVPSPRPATPGRHHLPVAGLRRPDGAGRPGSPSTSPGRTTRSSRRPSCARASRVVQHPRGLRRAGRRHPLRPDRQRRRLGAGHGVGPLAPGRRRQRPGPFRGSRLRPVLVARVERVRGQRPPADLAPPTPTTSTTAPPPPTTTSTVPPSTSTTVVPPDGECVAATNSAHIQAGRAHRPFLLVRAVGSNDLLGFSFQSSALRQTAPGTWERVQGC